MHLSEPHIFDHDLDRDTLDLYLHQPAIAIDTEAMGLISRRDRLCLVQLCDAQDRISLVRIARGDREAPHLQQLMEASAVVKIFHYARFDVGILLAHLGIRVNPIYCTKIASRLARTYTDKHGLRELVKELEQVEMDKEQQSSDWGSTLALTEAQIKYAANDVRYLIALRHKLDIMLEREERLSLAYACFEHLPTQVALDQLGYSDVFAH
ncbi:MAG: ribonuclease D [Oscillatoriales cyanobacterium SM2_2_1]|nr:ribonuclease D [Oscillatoriales cyanobacterium SM2_2_1]